MDHDNASETPSDDKKEESSGQGHNDNIENINVNVEAESTTAENEGCLDELLLHPSIAENLMDSRQPDEVSQINTQQTLMDLSNDTSSIVVSLLEAEPVRVTQMVGDQNGELTVDNERNAPALTSDITLEVMKLSTLSPLLKDTPTSSTDHAVDTTPVKESPPVDSQGCPLTHPDATEQLSSAERKVMVGHNEIATANVTPPMFEESQPIGSTGVALELSTLSAHDDTVDGEPLAHVEIDKDSMALDVELEHSQSPPSCTPLDEDTNGCISAERITSCATHDNEEYGSQGLGTSDPSVDATSLDKHIQVAPKAPDLPVTRISVSSACGPLLQMEPYGEVESSPPLAPWELEPISDSAGSQCRAESSTTALVLVSNQALKREIMANQQLAYTMLTASQIPYEVIDGADSSNLSRRNELFQLSGLRGQYPQFFKVVRQNQTAAADVAASSVTFVGDWEQFQFANECGTLRQEFGLEALRTPSPLALMPSE